MIATLVVLAIGVYLGALFTYIVMDAVADREWNRKHGIGPASHRRGQG